ncbi:MAG: aminopeptidase P family protein [Pseudolabrys sp.]|nr:aminopeptidase P family protein [Pseudolabrys sp.]
MLFRDDLKTIADKARAKVFAACGDAADVVVTVDPAHVGYLCGYRSVLLDADRTFRCAVIITRDRTVLITGASDAAPALEVMRDPANIYRYGMFFVSARKAAVDYGALPKAESTFSGALKAAIAATIKPQQVVGLDGVAEADAQQFKNLIDNRTIDARPSIIKARTIKLPEEIEKIRYAASITERGMEKALRHAAPGVTELELSALIANEIRAGGGIPRFVVVTAGERAALADAYATTAKLAKGDLLRLDIGCTVEGYWADTARTAVIGSPTREQQERYDALLEGELAQLALAKPGITVGDLFNVAMETVRKGALPNYQRTHCGHGIGIGAHEFPTLNTANQNVDIQEGMCFCVETPYYEIGWGGMMVEDMIVIRPGGNECLTKLPRELRQL